MNEIELIRAQLLLERRHASEVARACANVLSAAGPAGPSTSREAFRQAGVDYLVWILTRFEAREQLFHELLRARFAAEDPHRQAAETALALSGTSREALTKLETALRSGLEAHGAAHWTDFLRFFSGAWSTRRDELDRIFARQGQVADWRAVSAIDADSIFEERSRYARVRATLPAGVEMPATTAPHT